MGEASKSIKSHQLKSHSNHVAFLKIFKKYDATLRFKMIAAKSAPCTTSKKHTVAGFADSLKQSQDIIPGDDLHHGRKSLFVCAGRTAPIWVIKHHTPYSPFADQPLCAVSWTAHFQDKNGTNCIARATNNRSPSDL
jgi:hypothetical protein